MPPSSVTARAAKPDPDEPDYFGVESTYYEPTDRGEEAAIKARLDADAPTDASADEAAHPEG